MPISWLRRLGLFPEEPRPEERDIVDAIELRLEALGSGRAEHVAAFAGLLARVAYADDEITDPEAERIRDLVVEHAGLAREEAEAVALVARNKTVALRGSENHVLTRRFNEVASDEDKRRLVDCLYAVATADDLVTHVEDREIRRIGEALMLPPSQVLAIRSRYREKLEELRQLRSLRGEQS